MANAVQAAVAPRVEALAEPLARSLGLELVDVEYLREGPSWILRIFIDKPGGVNLDDCSALSHALGTALDVDDVVGTAYSLEVSSPGLERPLKKPTDFERFAGKRIKVKTYAPLVPTSAQGPLTPTLSPAGERGQGVGQKNFQGRLIGLKGDQVELETDGKPVQIPFTAIAKAHLVAEL
jgi:ribosome maturation factor RimP